MSEKLPELLDYPEKRLHDMQVSAYSEDVIRVKNLISEYTKINALNAHVRDLAERIAELEGKMDNHGHGYNFVDGIGYTEQTGLPREVGKPVDVLKSAEAERSCETCNTDSAKSNPCSNWCHDFNSWTSKPSKSQIKRENVQKEADRGY